MSSALNLIALHFVGFVSLTTCARINLNQQHAMDVDRGYGWVKDESKYICMMKWSKTFVKRGDRNQWCLVHFQQVKDALKKGVKTKEYKMKVSLRWGQCQSEEKKWAMNLCDLKGTKDVRVSFSSLRQVPKACFRISAEPFTPDKEHNVSIFEAAISASDCNHIIRRPEGSIRGKFAPTPTFVPPTLAPPTTIPAITTGTTITTATIVSTTTTTANIITENEAVATTSKTGTSTIITTTTISTTAVPTTATTTTIITTTTTTTTTTSTTPTTTIISTTTATSSTTSGASDELDITSEDAVDEETVSTKASTTPNLILEDGAREMQVSQEDADEDGVGLDVADGNPGVSPDEEDSNDGMEKEEDTNEAIDEEKPPPSSNTKSAFDFWRKREKAATRR